MLETIVRNRKNKNPNSQKNLQEYYQYLADMNLLLLQKFVKDFLDIPMDFATSVNLSKWVVTATCDHPHALKLDWNGGDLTMTLNNLTYNFQGLNGWALVEKIIKHL